MNRIKKNKLLFIGIAAIAILTCIIFGQKRVCRIENESDYYKGTFFENRESNSEITIIYPQIVNTDERSNELIRQAAYSEWGKTYEEATIFLEEWQKDSGLFESTVIDYETIYFTNDTASFLFNIFSVNGGPSYFGHYLVAINLRTSEYIQLCDLTSKNAVLEAIRSGNFKVYEGTYSEFDETDAHEQDIIDLMLQELEISLEKYSVEDGYNRYSSYNIGLDAEYLYLYVNLPNIAFHDYLILCIPLRDIIE
ncbi:MAG: hypothetical protein K2O34_04640 [Acetatifactor sp.]|nr:hypothetical protein [Acetatifactor sp.]